MVMMILSLPLSNWTTSSWCKDERWREELLPAHHKSIHGRWRVDGWWGFFQNWFRKEHTNNNPNLQCVSWYFSTNFPFSCSPAQQRGLLSILSPLSLFSPSQRRTVPHLGGILCPKRKERKKEEEMVMKVTRKRTAAWRRIRGKRNVYGDAWTWHDHPLLPWSRCWVQSWTGTKQEEKI